MSFPGPAFTPDFNPDAEGLAAIRAALRDVRVNLKRPAEHPYRDQALLILRDARVRIDAING
ncbi:MAG: hypothetical protein ACKVOP_08725 [Sphingomonadaceae bacterium]